MRAFPLDAKALANLDKVLHEPARLSVVGCLALVDEADFVFLQAQTGMTGGNLSSHVRKLEQAGYIAIRKEFVGARPRTALTLTEPGRAALASYVTALRHLIAVVDGEAARPGTPRPAAPPARTRDSAARVGRSRGPAARGPSATP